MELIIFKHLWTNKTLFTVDSLQIKSNYLNVPLNLLEQQTCEIGRALSTRWEISSFQQFYSVAKL